MDPLSAIGLAAAVLQFVKLAGGICSMAYRFHQDEYFGFQEGIWEETARNFENFSVIFRTQTDPNAVSGQETAQNEKALIELIGKCHTTAMELYSIWNRIARDEDMKNVNVHLNRRINKFKLFWKKSEVDRLLNQLKEYRDQLTPHILAHLNAGVTAIGESQSNIVNVVDSKASQITEILAVVQDNQKSLQSDMNRLCSAFDTTLSLNRLDHHNPAMAAFLTFSNGETRLLTRSDTGNISSQKEQQSLMTMRGADAPATIQTFEPVQTMVVDSLYFRKFQDRYDTVQRAHEKTYEWVFCSPDDEEPWYPFTQWLESKDGPRCYWINGKPGSGKSTLMKFISFHENTHKALDTWAGGDLVIATFYFWNLGSPLQRSQEGLLRSLLYQILTKHPWLISIVMPELWRLASKLPTTASLEPPSLVELKRWIRKALDKATTSLKFFLLIDGIDELEGDYGEIMELMNDLVENKNVKMLLSSRPISICVDTFRGFPSLRLQDLTRNDIQQYTADHLSVKLERKAGDEWTSLIDEITERSAGVFLWVILVVRSLADGLRKGDTIQEMHKRLDELPSNLKDLYDHIIRNLEPRYRREASELFQMLLKAQEVQSPAGFPWLIQVYFCGVDPDQMMAMPIAPLEAEVIKAKCDDTDDRARSRCWGLLESRQFRTGRTNLSTKSPVMYHYLDFIHRTVVEFLRLPEVWADMSNLTASPRYEPSPQLFRSCIMMCKTLPKSRGLEPSISIIWHMMDRALIYASMAEDSKTPVPRQHLKELDRVLKSHWSDILKCYSHLGSLKNDGHWAKGYSLDPQRQNMLNPNDFASVALFHGLEDYLAGELANRATARALNTTQLLIDAIKYIDHPQWGNEHAKFDGSLTSEAALWMERQGELRKRWANIVISLLEKGGAEPNRDVNGDNAWSLVVERAAAAGETHTRAGFHRELEARGFAHLFAKMLAAFIRHGADLKLSVTSGSEAAWQVIYRLFSHEPGALADLDPWAETPPQVPVGVEVSKMHAYFKKIITDKGIDVHSATSGVPLARWPTRSGGVLLSTDES